LYVELSNVLIDDISTSPCKFYERVKSIEEKILLLLARINEEKDSESETLEKLASLLIDSINKRNITIKSLD
jgi:hypothetical protein